MCCVFGMVSPVPLGAALDLGVLLPLMFKEAQIRGKHASGITYRGPGGRLITVKAPVPGGAFCRQLDLGAIERSTAFIAHCRYSTSDLDFNQPIADADLSLVHNGVMTQTPPEEWPDSFGMEFQTRNDSEILFNLIKAHQHPWSILPESSQAAIALSGDDFWFWRNTKRPLWSTALNLHTTHVVAVASTSDVLKRGLGAVCGRFTLTEPGIIYSTDGTAIKVKAKQEAPYRKDLQR